MRVQAFLIFLPLLLAGCSAPNGEGDVPGTDAEKEVILGVGMPLGPNSYATSLSHEVV